MQNVTSSKEIWSELSSRANGSEIIEKPGKVTELNLPAQVDYYNCIPLTLSCSLANRHKPKETLVHW